MSSPAGILIATADISMLLGSSWYPSLVRPEVSRIVQCGRERTAVYLGAANQDDENYFAMYQAVAERAGATHCMHVKEKSMGPSDAEFIRNRCCLVILGGGDTPHAWRVFLTHGIDSALHDAIDAGVPVLGISAGAIQLGVVGLTDPDHRIRFRGPLKPVHGPASGAARAPAGQDEVEAPYWALGRLPLIAAAHEEANGWAALRAGLASMHAVGLQYAGLGLPYGSGVALLPDGTLEIGTRDKKSDQGVAVPLLLLPCRSRACVGEAVPISDGTACEETLLQEISLELGTRWRLSDDTSTALVCTPRPSGALLRDLPPM